MNPRINTCRKQDWNGSSLFILITGDMVKGFEFFGPLEGYDFAYAWAEQYTVGPVTIAPLQPPTALC